MGQDRLQEDYKTSKFLDEGYSETRLNLNDLLKKRQAEKKIDKKTNILIFSAASAVLAVVIVILTL